MDLQHAVLSISSLPLKYKSLKHQQNKVIVLANLFFSISIPERLPKNDYNNEGRNDEYEAESELTAPKYEDHQDTAGK